MSCLPMDTETTSLDFREAEVIELGFALLMRTGKWEPIDYLYKPAHTVVTPEISAVTHITQKMVENKPFFGKRIEGDFNAVIDTFGDGLNLVAHNAFYDSKVLENYNLRKFDSPWLCTMRMAKKLYADDDTVTQFNLPYLRYRFELDIPSDMPHHRAGTDAYMAAMLFEHLITEMEEQEIIDKNLPYRPQVEEWLAAPITITKMPFGKHKGKPLAEVPLDYWKWALKNLNSLDEEADEYDADFATSVANVLEALL